MWTKLRRLGLKVKLMLSFFTMAFCIFIVGVLGFFILNKVLEQYNRVTSINLPSIMLISELKSSVRQLEGETKSLAIEDLTSDERKSIHQRIELEKTNFLKAAKALETYLNNDSERTLYQSVIKNWNNYLPLITQAIECSNMAKPDLASIKFVIFFNAPDVIKSLNKDVDELTKNQNQQANSWVKSAVSEAEKGKILSCVIIATGCILSLFIGYILSKNVSLALNKVIHNLSQDASTIATESDKLSNSSETLSQGVNNQASSIHETASAVEQMNAMIQKNSENSIKSREASSECNNAALKGNAAVNDMLNVMLEISLAIQEISKQVAANAIEMENIVKVISEIEGKTQIINDIAFQTKLLSFNASVEASRAGEHGKGFSVVAEEVGKLAAVSSEAAKDITTLLKSSLNKVTSIASENKSQVDTLVIKSESKVKLGMDVAIQCESSLNEIVTKTQGIVRMIAEISDATKEQAEGVHEITEAIRNFNDITQANAQSSQVTAEASRQLTGQAMSLQGSVELLSEMVKGA